MWLETNRLIIRSIQRGRRGLSFLVCLKMGVLVKLGLMLIVQSGSMIGLKRL